MAAFFVLSLLTVSGTVRGDAYNTELVVEKADGSKYAFATELALTTAQRNMGMMFRKKIAPNQGMLFIFKDSDFRRFWMRNTYIPLDIIYLKADGSIINIVANAEPRTDTGRPSEGKAKAVFEIAGGRAEELGIKVGDVIRHALLGNMKAAGSAAADNGR
ncbi:MAG: hypothetical protein COB37_05370 [Kordiimonadales bacterium]|nr:MAG: hypothetical protein COB37_05370 [Kordiimonadales bacterium]